VTDAKAIARTPAAVFGALWDAMADVMGSATTATLLRRAARRGVVRHPDRGDLAALEITREGFEYRYRLPPSWSEAGPPATCVCPLVLELRPLLVELTGPVVLRRLVEIPELVECGLTPLSEEEP
jgi:hypothetical protein